MRFTCCQIQTDFFGHQKKNQCLYEGSSAKRNAEYSNNVATETEGVFSSANLNNVLCNNTMHKLQHSLKYLCLCETPSIYSAAKRSLSLSFVSLLLLGFYHWNARILHSKTSFFFIFFPIYFSPTQK